MDSQAKRLNEIEPGDLIKVGMNHHKARVIGVLPMQLDDGTNEHWMTIALPQNVSFEVWK